MRVVGYYNSFGRHDNLEKLNLTALTHINYAFLLPKVTGELYFIDDDDVKKIVDLAHSLGIKIFVSVGGWCNENDEPLNRVFEMICDNNETRNFFIDNLVEIAKNFGFDGVDFDWEYPTIEYKESFEYIISSLSKKLHDVGKEITIAIYHSIEGEEKFNRICAISDNVISNLDFINVMTYDCHEEENHSSMELAKKCVDYWVNKRRINKNKILIGIAFYSKPSLIPYYDLISKSVKNAYRNFCGKDSYNGLYLVRDKANFAKLSCGGVFIWAINYDTTDSYSLLFAITGV